MSQVSKNILQFTFYAAVSQLLIILAYLGVGTGILPYDTVNLLLTLSAFFISLILSGMVLFIIFRAYTSAQSNNGGQPETQETTSTTSELRDKAETAATEAVAAKADDDLGLAVDSYRDAIDQYQTAVEMSDDSETTAEIKATIQQLQSDLDEVQSLTTARSSLRDAIQPAEESFQTAVVSHVTNQHTVARVRYRQARDQFEAAIEQLETTDIELATAPVELSVTTGTDLPSKQLREIPALSTEAAGILGDFDIETVDDLQSITDSDQDVDREPTTIDELKSDEEISEDCAATLTALSLWHNNEAQSFADYTSLTKRYDQANVGFAATK